MNSEDRPVLMRAQLLGEENEQNLLGTFRRQILAQHVMNNHDGAQMLGPNWHQP